MRRQIICGRLISVDMIIKESIVKYIWQSAFYTKILYDQQKCISYNFLLSEDALDTIWW